MHKIRWLSRILILLITILFFSNFSVMSEEIETYENLLVLGDSISTGYGLENYSPNNVYICNSYANTLANQLNLMQEESYFNYAKDGYQSKDLLALLPNLKSRVQEADLIIVSIGGNEYLQNMPELVSAVTNQTCHDLEDCIHALLSIEKKDVLEGLASENTQRILSNILSEYEENLNSIATYLLENSSNAKILFLLQYNPIPNTSLYIPAYVAFHYMIRMLNTTMSKVLKQLNLQTIDVPSKINDNTFTKTNILSLDIHPNNKGHHLIYQLLVSAIFPSKSETERSLMPETQTARDPEEKQSNGCYSRWDISFLLPIALFPFILSKKFNR